MLLQAVEHTLITLDGQTHRASELRVSVEKITLGDTELLLADVDSIRLAGESAPLRVPSTGVLLQDGSWLPANEISIAAVEDALQVESPFGSFVIPLEYVAAWGERAALPTIDALDVLVLANGNQPFGEIAGANDGSILMQTELMDEPLPMPMESIVAARLRPAPIVIDGLYLELRTDAYAPPLRIWPGERPRLAIAQRESKKQFLFQDWSKCAKMRVIGGRRVFLSDLKPSVVEEKGLFGKVWKYALNSNIDGSPLMLGGQRFDQAVVMHSYSLLKWKLDKKYTRFHSIVAISDALGNEGNCIVRIFIDGKIQWEDLNVRGGKAVQRVDLDVSAADELSIEVDYGERYDIGDHCAFGAAYFIKSKK